MPCSYQETVTGVLQDILEYKALLYVLMLQILAVLQMMWVRMGGSCIIQAVGTSDYTLLSSI